MHKEMPLGVIIGLYRFLKEFLVLFNKKKYMLVGISSKPINHHGWPSSK